MGAALGSGAGCGPVWRASRNGLLGAGLALGLVVGLTGCGSSTPTAAQPTADLPNIAQVQLSMDATILKHDHVHVTMTCPSVVPEVTNEKFSCVGVSTGRHPQVFTFLATEGGGTYVSYQQTS